MSKRVLAVVASAAVMAGPGAATAAAPDKNIVETAKAAGSFKTLVKLAKRAGLAGTLSGKARYTVFAPTDAAFDRVPDKTLNALANDRKMLRRVLLYHVLVKGRSAAKLAQAPNPRTAEGSRVRLTFRGGKAKVNGRRIVAADVRASNGIIHAINGVLLPPSNG